MEKLGFEGLAILLILLPGFLCAGLIQALCVRPTQTELDKVWEALLYSFVVYVAFVCLVGPVMPVGLRITQDGVQQYSVELQPKTSRSSVWGDTFHEYCGVILVELGDGRRIEGWVRYYSDEPTPASLFLEKAAWVTDENTLNILITQELGIRTIEFLRWTIQAEEPEKSAVAS